MHLDLQLIHLLFTEASRNGFPWNNGGQEANLKEEIIEKGEY